MTLNGSVVCRAQWEPTLNGSVCVSAPEGALNSVVRSKRACTAQRVRTIDVTNYVRDVYRSGHVGAQIAVAFSRPSWVATAILVAGCPQPPVRDGTTALTCQASPLSRASTTATRLPTSYLEIPALSRKIANATVERSNEQNCAELSNSVSKLRSVLAVCTSPLTGFRRR